MTTRGAAVDFHVAIVGAGIAGLALAMGLQRRGVPFTLYEEAAAYSAVGAGIGFAPNGLQASDLIQPGFRPLYEAIAVGNKPDNAQHVFFEGMLLAQGLGRSEQWFGKSSWGHPDFSRKSAHRKALLDIMTSFIPTEKVRFSKRLTRIQHQADQAGVELTFDDGEVIRARVLIGADGIQSTTRAYVLGSSHPEQVRPVYADAYCYRAVIPTAEAEEILGDLTHVAKNYFGDRRCAVTYRISGGEEFNFLLCVHHEGGWPHQDRVTDRTTHESMMSDFQGRGIDERFLRLLSRATPVKWGLFHHLRTATYVKDRMALCGDSAHASLPWQAAGAAQGVEDALVLCSLLSAVSDATNKQGRGGPSLEAALHAYDAVRRPRAQRQLEQAFDDHKSIFWQGEEGGDMARILAKLRGEQRFTWLWFTDMQDEVDRALSEYRRRLGEDAKVDSQRADL